MKAEGYIEEGRDKGVLQTVNFEGDLIVGKEELTTMLKDFSNQRVIEELEGQKDRLIKVYGDMCEETFHSYVDELISSVVKRIKELKTKL